MSLPIQPKSIKALKVLLVSILPTIGSTTVLLIFKEPQQAIQRFLGLSIVVFATIIFYMYLDKFSKKYERQEISHYIQIQRDKINILKENLNKNFGTMACLTEFIKDKTKSINSFMSSPTFYTLAEITNIQKNMKEILRAIYEITNKNLKNGFQVRISFMEPRDEALYITNYYNKQNIVPRSMSLNYPFKYDKEKKSCAGYALYNWKKEKGLPYYLISSVPEHLKLSLSRRIFDVVHDEQQDCIRSIVSIVVYNREERFNEEVGVLNIDSDDENYFTKESYERRICPYIKPLLAYIVFIYNIKKIMEHPNLTKLIENLPK